MLIATFSLLLETPSDSHRIAEKCDSQFCQDITSVHRVKADQECHKISATLCAY